MPKRENTKIQFQAQSFLKLDNFKDEEFDFVLDIGCFHHVKIKDRDNFINGVFRVLKKGSPYFVYCFSYRNVNAWNHFTKEELIQIFSNYYKIKDIQHIDSVEGDSVMRYFYAILMEKK
jgi:ubiquinone/menaquinone biosynthesis C-methylase UbiE